MLRKLIITGLLFSIILQTNQSLADVETLRLDYYHTGDHQQEIFSRDQVIIEPLPWPGSPTQVLDNLDRGKYRFIVRDKTSSKVLFTRGYSSIYGEWETTGEAKRIKRTYHESLRFPKPENTVLVTIEKRDKEFNFKEVWTTEVDPNNYLNLQESATYKDQIITIEQNGDPKDKVDLLILGDGYTKAELADFEKTARAMTEALFATSPFKERRKDFNVWALAPLTKESGVSRPSTGVHHDSPLGTSYDAFGSERYVLTTDNRNFRKIASSAPYDFVEILVNNETYGGGGIFGFYSTAAAKSDWANYLFIHEFGHHFAGLADEYYTSDVAYSTPEVVIEPYEPNVTALLENEPLKWQQLATEKVALPTPWPKDAYEKHSYEYQEIRKGIRKNNQPESVMNQLFRDNQNKVNEMFSKAENNDVIGAFEGANYSAKGYYRSQLNCIMFTRTEHFCTVCQHAITDMINLYSKQ
jgi:hypothetical protein